MKHWLGLERGLSVWLMVGVLALVATLLLGPLGALTVSWQQQNVDYPDALLIGDVTSYAYSPALTLRRVTNFRTDKHISTVLGWYVTEFGIGTFVRTQGNCMSMRRVALELFVIERRFSVSLCETSTGQTIVVRRSWILRWQ